MIETFSLSKVNAQFPTVGLPYPLWDGYICVVEKPDRTWETACHLSALLLMVPFFMLANVIAPFVIWIIRKNQSPGVDRHGRAVVNFQLAMTLYFGVLYLLSKISPLAGPAGICLRIWTYLNIILILRAAYQAAQGQLYKYPFTIRFLPQ